MEDQDAMIKNPAKQFLNRSGSFQLPSSRDRRLLRDIQKGGGTFLSHVCADKNVPTPITPL